IPKVSLTGFPAQSVGSSNTYVLDLPCLLVLITGTSQSRQHVDTSSIHIESRKSPTAVLFDDDTGRISIRHCHDGVFNVSNHIVDSEAYCIDPVSAKLCGGLLPPSDYNNSPPPKQIRGEKFARRVERLDVPHFSRSLEKAFQDMLHELGEVNPVHAYYNGSCTSKDNEDPSWSTSFKTRRTSKTSSALEALWKTLFMLYLYKIGTLIILKCSTGKSMSTTIAKTHCLQGLHRQIPLCIINLHQGPILSMILNGLMFRESAYQFPKANTPFQAIAFKWTMSPTWKFSIGLRLTSA
ncbi:hypothetical protein Tco_0458872, partial [Tanacetum coccineum]